ncbi:hypothetical protein BJ085DRAFT_22330 [Dimargaris cristalligena]|uniref:Queuosine 5'-phosphate N-glycosylase/hydrolase n=1 Tax=Dimargaris cristalligena TaxID=215637 RepID=A0A4P9ZV26_9FUNG|nr:hypothetical protein BJ085DRAFT_22330 [Dimargaris cristalligena]|eukprot:RKP37434.1 hypothetical protein BJ085DRAFT_22330 [Dimargaris cristalligena]
MSGPVETTYTYPELVRSSCRYLVEQSPDVVQIDSTAIDRFLDSINVERFAKLCKGWIAFPLKFDTPEDEVTLVALIDLLNFGSGYRKELHAATGRGASDTILFGCMGLYLSGSAASSAASPLSAEALTQLHLADVASVFGIPLLGPEEPHPTIPGLTLSQPSPLRELVQKLTDTMVETGRILKAGGYRSLGQFILEATKKPDHAPVHWRPSVADLVGKLVTTFPAFQDYKLSEQHDIYLIKRAQLLVADLNERFKKPESPVFAHFDFPDVPALTVFADNVLPTVLGHLGILRITSSSLQTSINALEPISEDNMWILRAAAVQACELDPQSADHISHLAREMQHATVLDHYLWHVGKDPEIRNIPRLVYKDTVFF